MDVTRPDPVGPASASVPAPSAPPAPGEEDSWPEARRHVV
jgi:hypothetical protein